MRDAVAIEQFGVPAVVIVTEPFEPTAALTARAAGYPELSVAVIDHPLASLDADGVRARAEQASAAVERILTGQY